MAVAIFVVLILIVIIGKICSGVRNVSGMSYQEADYIRQRKAMVRKKAILYGMDPNEYDRLHMRDYEQYHKHMGDYDMWKGLDD